MKRTVNAPTEEPEQMSFELPSEGEHLFQISNVFETKNKEPDIALVKCEVALGNDMGTSLLNRLNLDPESRGFFATRLLLKAIGLDYKGNFEIDTDNFIGKQFYATVIHNGKFANIAEYNFEKMVDQPSFIKKEAAVNTDEVAWDEGLK